MRMPWHQSSEDASDIILRNFQSPGDILVLTAAVRDLHLNYPGRFRTAVESSVPELWEGNPFVCHADCLVHPRELQCNYPLIHSANQNGRHFLTSFHDFLSRELGVHLNLTRFMGDVYLREHERRRPSVLVSADRGRPVWLVNAGGKFDFTAKWWPTEYYQKVVDRLAERVTFVQVGSMEHYHPRLLNVIDARGRTSTRELLSLVYWADGVLTPVSFLMHLAAAVPANESIRAGLRPCVVLGGGREPVSWEAYPGHQYLHNIGQLACCSGGACWKSRTTRLNDGSEQDNSLCLQPDGMFAKCMTMIKPDVVTAAITAYL